MNRIELIVERINYVYVEPKPIPYVTGIDWADKGDKGQTVVRILTPSINDDYVVRYFTA